MGHVLDGAWLQDLAELLSRAGLPPRVDAVIGQTVVFEWKQGESTVIFASVVQNVVCETGSTPEVRLQFPPVHYLGRPLCHELLILGPGVAEFYRRGEKDDVVSGSFFLLT